MDRLTARVATTPASRALLALVAAVLLAAPAAVQADESEVVARSRSSAGQVVLRRVVGDLNAPWSLAPLPRGGALVTERTGRLLYVDNLDPGTARVFPVAGAPAVAVVGQGGLLDVVVSPDFPRDRLVYLSYAARSGGGAVTRVSRARLAGDSPSNLRLVEMEELFSLNRVVSTGHHFGSRLVFDNEGYLYITVGERGQREQAQNPASHQGTVVRLNPDGSVPASNPAIPGGAPGIFTWGHRNPQGAALNPTTGEVWIHEHGPRGGDEINVLSTGANYGWPRLTDGVAYSGRPIAEADSLPGFADPLVVWTPSIAPSGMAFVIGDRYPEWQGDVVVGALAGQHLRRVDLDADQRPQSQEVLFTGYARFRDVRQAPDGYLYVLTDGADGALLRLEAR